MSDIKKTFDGIELGALWRNERGTLSGKLGNARCVIIENKRKQPGEKTPDFRIFVFPKDKDDAAPKAPGEREPGGDDDVGF